MNKPLLLLLIFCCLYSCRFEPKEPPKYNHKISGRLLKSCAEPVPVKGAELMLYSNRLKGGAFYDRLRQSTFTDSLGNFTFDFRSARWVETDDRRSTYFAEIQDSAHNFLIHGVQPGIHNIGDVYLEREFWVKMHVTVVRSSIKPGDTLELSPGKSNNYFTHGSDTAYYFDYEPISGKENGFIEVNSNGVFTNYRIKRNGEQIAYGKDFIEMNVCDTAHYWQFAVPDSVY